MHLLDQFLNGIGLTKADVTFRPIGGGGQLIIGPNGANLAFWMPDGSIIPLQGEGE